MAVKKGSKRETAAERMARLQGQVSDVFNEEFLKEIEKLYIISKKVFAGRMRAERRTKKLGSGVEFAEHREYSPGDDFRYIDWNIYGRMDKLFLRLFEEEEDLHVYILLDVSNSMTMGNPPKYLYAMQIGAALAYIALSNLDRVGVVPFAERTLGRLPPTRGVGRIDPGRWSHAARAQPADLHPSEPAAWRGGVDLGFLRSGRLPGGHQHPSLQQV